MSKHLYDEIHHTLILALRAGHETNIQATLAHYQRGTNRKYHIGMALEEADKVTNAAAALRTEIARLEAEENAEVTP